MEVVKFKKNIIENENKIIYKVAAYARVSTESDIQINSFESQKLYYENKINNNENWRLVDIYADEGISGTSTKKRENFLRMINDAMKGKIDIILTKSISRFARNTVDTLKYVRLLKDRNVAVIFEEENINTLDKSGEFLLTVLSSVAQQESENIASHVKLGHDMLLKRGELILGNGCYGYRFNNDEMKIEIVSEEACIVKEIYELFLNGVNLNTIKKIMESKDYITYYGRKNWDTTNIKNILTNEKYSGDLLQMKKVRKVPLGKRKKNTGFADQYLIENFHEAIISKEDFERVQEIFKEKYDSSKYRKKIFSCLTSKTKCGFCNGRVIALREKKTGVFVGCVDRKNHSRSVCPNSMDMHRDKIINIVKKGLNNYKNIILKSNYERLSYAKSILENNSDITDDVISKIVKLVFVGGYDSYNRPNPYMIRIILNSYYSINDYQLQKLTKEDIEKIKTDKLYENWVSQSITMYGPPGDNYKRKEISKVKVIIEIEKDEDCTLV